MAISPSINVLLCEFKYDDRQERRYCFEMISPTRNWQFQAETEQEFVSWLQTFEQAKREAVVSNKNDVKNAVKQEEKLIIIEDEEFETITTMTTNVSNVSNNNNNTSNNNVTHNISNTRVKYPDVSYERRNEELHGCIRSVQETEFVLDCFPVSVKKDDLKIQGRLYLTQSLICFYSNILNIVTTVSVICSIMFYL